MLGFFGCSDENVSAPKQDQLTQETQPTPAKFEKVELAYQPGEAIPAMAYIEHNEVYNAESVIPPQCYTKTDGVNNPCYACHQTYSRDEQRPNILSDGSLQGSYDFSDLGFTNHWKNLFVDRRPLIEKISDDDIKQWINQDNYSDYIQNLKADKAWKGEIPEIENLAFPEQAFGKLGLANDGSYWVAFNYKPFPSTFWPTNGSTGDAMIRLPNSFREISGQFSQDVYFANLALVEMALKDTQSTDLPTVSEKVIGVDINADGRLDSEVNTIARQDNYLGDASAVKLAKMLYPEGTEFLHTVRYIGVDDAGNIFNAPRMKEVRYMKKHKFRSKASLKASYEREIKEKAFGQLPQTISNGDKGINNTFGWTINGHIEDENGQLRPQHHQEMMFCNGCHRTLGATFDQTFSFPRKVDGAKGWGYFDLTAMSDVPNIGEQQGEFLTYMQRVGGGDEFRQNKEMLQRWFNPDGSVNVEKVESVDSLYDLITPSPRRALDLNKAYLTIVKEQSYLFGRDATLVEATNVLREVDDSQAPLQEENRFEWDMRLNWQQAHEYSYAALVGKYLSGSTTLIFLTACLLMGLGIGADVAITTMARSGHLNNNPMQKWCWIIGVTATHTLFPMLGYLLAYFSVQSLPALTPLVGLIAFACIFWYLKNELLARDDESTDNGSLFVSFGLILAVSWDALWSGPAKSAQVIGWPELLVWLSFALVGAVVAFCAIYSLRLSKQFEHWFNGNNTQVVGFGSWLQYTVIGYFGILALSRYCLNLHLNWFELFVVSGVLIAVVMEYRKGRFSVSASKPYIKHS